MIVNQTNIPVWRWSDNRAFGNYLPDEDPDGDSQLFEYNLRFAGQYFDSETNLHYNYFRDYDPETGRYISSDPIGLAGGLNTYGYALQNPLSFNDPTGEAAQGAAGALAIFCAASPANAAACAATAQVVIQACQTASDAISDFLNRPFIENRGNWPLDQGGEEWGRRNGVGAAEGRRRAHGVKGKDKGRPLTNTLSIQIPVM